MSAPVVDIVAMAVGAVAELVKIGFIREEQRRDAEHAAIVGMRAVGPDVAAHYRAELEARERSDADEVLRRRAIRDGLLGLASRESAPPTNDEGKG